MPGETLVPGEGEALLLPGETRVPDGEGEEVGEDEVDASLFVPNLFHYFFSFLFLQPGNYQRSDLLPQ